jgi:type II secretory pathway predicted ATPase ExeA
MYLAHFGFTHYPFERALQPDELFASRAAREAQARLNHLVELRGIGLITGCCLADYFTIDLSHYFVPFAERSLG